MFERETYKNNFLLNVTFFVAGHILCKKLSVDLRSALKILCKQCNIT